MLKKPALRKRRFTTFSFARISRQTESTLVRRVRSLCRNVILASELIALSPAIKLDAFFWL
jgi:hypothetical protein